MANAAIYARLSNENEESTSTTRQRKECRDYAAAHGLTVIREFVDEGISGYSGKHRPAMEEMIDRLKAGEFDTIIIWKLDRLSRRGISQMGEFLNVLKECNGRLLSVMDNVDSAQGVGTLMIAMLSELAHMESQNTSTRIKAQKREAREAGKWLQGSNVPWGYVMTEDKKLAHCPETAATARQVIEMFLAGSSTSQVLDWLHANDIPSPTGKKWSKPTLTDWTRSPALCGLQVELGQRGVAYRSPETGQPVSIGDGLATEAEWRTIATLREQRSPSSKKRGASRSKNTLAGLVTCADCGGKMSVASSWRCNNERIRRTCKGCSIGVHLLEGHVEALMLNRISALDVEDQLIVRVAEAWRGEVQPVVDVVGLESDLADLEARLNALFEDRYTKNRFAGREQLFDSLHDALTAEIGDVKASIDSSPSTDPRQHFVDFSDPEVIRTAWEFASVADKRATAAAVIDTVKVERRGRGGAFDPTRIEVIWRD